MPLLIRELNIKVNVDQGAGASRAAGDDAGRDAKSADAQTLQRAIEEVLRIEAAKQER